MSTNYPMQMNKHTEVLNEPLETCLYCYGREQWPFVLLGEGGGTIQHGFATYVMGNISYFSYFLLLNLYVFLIFGICLCFS